MRTVPDSDVRRCSGFARIAEEFLAQPGLPMADVLSAEHIKRVFVKHGNLFGRSVYSTAVVLWSFLAQVLRDGKEASCQSAVARIIYHQQQLGAPVPTGDTGDYCRARAKLSEAALRDLTREIGAEVEERAEDTWLWKGRHAKLVDGFTFTMPDTPENQQAYPQPKSQKPGIGFPIARAAVLISLATACVLDLAIKAYSGKKTGETALLREMLDSFSAGDVAVADRYYGAFLMIALLLNRQVDVCVRLHQRRKNDFRRGQRLGPDDHLIVWTRPRRPKWMDEATYATIPETLTLRKIRFHVTVPGLRTRVLTVVTTLLDPEAYTREEIAQLYGYRWNAELDIRAIKQSLNLNHVRSKSPEMVRRECWTTILAYNLIRTTAASAAALHGATLPRQISFTGTCQYILAGWMTLPHDLSAAELARRCRELLVRIAACRVADRPGRIEPRVLKKRRHGYPLMTEPRSVLRTALERN